MEVTKKSQMPKYIRRNSSGYSSDISDLRSNSKELFSPPNSERMSSPKPEQRNRMMSIDNSNLTEVITIYERLQRGQEEQSVTRKTTKEIRRMSAIPRPILEANSSEDFDKDEASGPYSSEPDPDQENNKFTLTHPAKYIYFSESTDLLIADKITRLSTDFQSLLQKKNYWLNISDPSEEDYLMLFHSYNVHDLTIADITNGATEEKVEAYSHYTFFSLCLNDMDDELDYSVVGENDADPLFDSEKTKKNFYILLFKDFVITCHRGLATHCLDILDFLSLLLKNFSDTFNPEWVFFSIFLQISRNVKSTVQTVEIDVNKIRVGQYTPEVHNMMRENMFLELSLYMILKTLKPKVNILRQLKSKCSKRISQTVLRLLDEIMDDFKEVKEDLNHFNQILERSQDTFLALVTSEQTKEANELNKVMKRIGEIALTFLPLTLTGSFFGMNVSIPFQTDNYPDVLFFYILVCGSIFIGMFLYMIRNRVLDSI